MSAGAHNAMVVEALMKDVQIILSVPELTDIKTEDPLQIQRVTNSHESGHAEPFNARQGAIALKSTNKYDAGMNYWWQDFEWMDKRSSVPLVADAIDRYALATWPDPAQDLCKFDAM